MYYSSGEVKYFLSNSPDWERVTVLGNAWLKKWGNVLAFLVDFSIWLLSKRLPSFISANPNVYGHPQPHPLVKNLL